MGGSRMITYASFLKYATLWVYIEQRVRGGFQHCNLKTNKAKLR
jgi:hypothetical protein